MDPKANLKEQLKLSKRIIKTWNDCPDGQLTQEQDVELAGLAERLAKLVLALDGWMRRGFSSYA